MPFRAPVNLPTKLMLLIDVAAIALTWPAALLSVLSPGEREPGWYVLYLGLLYPAVHLLFLYALGLYRRDTMSGTRRALARIPLVAAISTLAASVLAILLDWLLLPRHEMAANRPWIPLAAFLAFAAGGMAARLCFRALRRRGVIRRRLLVVGAGSRAWELTWILGKEGRSLMYEVVFAHAPTFGAIDPRLADGSAGRVVSLLKPQLLETAQRYRIDQIVVAPDDRRGMGLMDLLACKTAGFPVSEYLTFVEAETRRIDLKRLDVGWLLYSDDFYFGFFDRAFKRLLDVTVSVVLLVPALPLLLLSMIAIKLDDRGPIFYRQTRITRGMRQFGIVKLRTMSVNAESTGAVWAATKDNRITRVGNFLRRSRLDELPQLFNVLRGDMSLVGPRPERPTFVGMLAEAIPLYGERHLVKAGLTGWAQINYPYGASIDDARSKLSYDLYYVKNFSALFDILIVLQTLRVVLFPGNSVR